MHSRVPIMPIINAALYKKKCIKLQRRKNNHATLYRNVVAYDQIDDSIPQFALHPHQPAMEM